MLIFNRFLNTFSPFFLLILAVLALVIGAYRFHQFLKHSYYAKQELHEIHVIHEKKGPCRLTNDVGAYLECAEEHD